MGRKYPHFSVINGDGDAYAMIFAAFNSGLDIGDIRK
jgi:hypothetical protein